MPYSYLITALSFYLGKPHQGKVRDSFRIMYRGKFYRLVLVSDRISIFDFVLGPTVEQKGYILNALNIFWRLHLRMATKEDFPEFQDDLVAFGSSIQPYLPLMMRLFDRRLCKELWKRAVVVEELNMIQYEGVKRWHLAGGGFRTYKKSLEQNGGKFGVLCGHKLPAGLREEKSSLEVP